jgi:large subunit ribosomal protein L6
MSRIGKLPINIPASVQVTAAGSVITVKCDKNILTKNFSSKINFLMKDNQLYVENLDSTSTAMQGTVRSIVFSMIQGVQKHYVKNLEIQGTGFKALLKNNKLDLSLGYSHPIVCLIPEGITVTVLDGGVKLVVQGSDKQLVGQVAANIKNYYPVEPYKGKGVRIQGEFVRRKEGKKTA